MKEKVYHFPFQLRWITSKISFQQSNPSFTPLAFLFQLTWFTTSNIFQLRWFTLKRFYFPLVFWTFIYFFCSSFRLKWVVIEKVNGGFLCQDSPVMCGGFLFLDIHALIISKNGNHANIHNLHINEQWKAIRGEGLCIDEGFFVGYAFLAFLSFKETSNRGPPFMV